MSVLDDGGQLFPSSARFESEQHRRFERGLLTRSRHVDIGVVAAASKVQCSIKDSNSDGNLEVVILDLK
jgi:hypothetical protein